MKLDDSGEGENVTNEEIKRAIIAVIRRCNNAKKLKLILSTVMNIATK